MKTTEAEYISPSFQSKDPMLNSVHVCAYQFTLLTIPVRLQKYFLYYGLKFRQDLYKYS